jgi:hypothetical protein
VSVKDIKVNAAAGSLSARDRQALDELGDSISDLYDTGYADCSFWAYRLAGGPLLAADTLAGLDSAIREDRHRSRLAAGYAR